MINPSDVLKSILAKKADQAEVFFSSSKTLKIDVLDQKVESIDEIEEQGIGIRVIKDNKLGFAYTSDFDETVLEETITRAIDNAANSEADEHNALPQKAEITILNLFDEKINRVPVAAKIKLALAIEKAAYAKDNKVKKTEKISYADSESEVWIVNSNGIDAKYKSNYCGAHADVIAVQDHEMEAGFGLSYVTKFDDLNPEKVGAEAAQRAVQLLGARPIRSQKLSLVLDPFVSTQILEVIASILSSDAAQKGKSLFADKLGKQVGSKLLTIIDNGRLENGLATAPFDGEGVPTQETKLIENGRLKTFFFNTYTANKGQTQSTGNAVRGSFKGLPMIGPTNLFIPAGKDDPKFFNQGFYVTRVMGVHTINPISGDFSIGASGILLENQQPVRGITIAGNLIALLEKIEGIGSDLRFIANVGAPTILISDISIGGS
ncbi:hypothetical protein A3H38_02410 [candidate division WOR-1 bacterium RIFCSPLOWO2_02_FULL_46_20]|uniref:Peptidase C69 n=2 Tax=Saganbacteria TaxID=1703751 RepID=A0A1F4R8N2_UNCSA|nr:MAG: hypothetical protein A3H38_02410 [candidate division WOR-1 bacterium RIFCSPLOWO2_02_FULL_46_20]OGC09320.1 MAG: hypothetical protein A3F86_00510 [candidate division WOR-1 bacterium RIFCSPLOWO2_12_FULL_45_9]